MEAIIAEQIELFSQCNNLERRLLDTEEDTRHVQIEKTALAERIKTLELENRSFKAEI